MLVLQANPVGFERFRGKECAALTKQMITTIFTKQLNERYSKESAAS